ncbi:MAG: DUF2461 domain-containing protein [Oscillospiraceae bacterium]|jgi:uncharacterized protein (TIGR02453 family)|nr:DUF2461 domain-containing protein [Oscillospiraceae bacterium]
MFTGFSPEAIDFLWGIRFNNNREWFSAHKQQYQDALYAPMKEMAAEFAAAFSHLDGMQMKLSRIYRDMRMNPATPYKESLWWCLRRTGGDWAQEPSLFFEITPETYAYGFLYIAPKAATLERYRKLLAEKPDEFPQIVEKAQRETGISLTGDSYSRKKPCADARLAPYYNLKNIFLYHRRENDALLFSREVVQEVKKTLDALVPLVAFCQKFAY